MHCHAGPRLDVRGVAPPIPAAIDEFVVYIGGDVPVGDYQPLGQRRASAPRSPRTSATVRRCSWPTTASSPSASRSTMRCTRPLVVEHNAKIMWGAQQLGGVVALPDKTIRNFTGVYGYVRGQTWVTEP